MELNPRQRVPATFIERVGKSLARKDHAGRTLTRHLNQIWKRPVATPTSGEAEDLLPSSPNHKSVSSSPSPSDEQAEAEATPQPGNQSYFRTLLFNRPS